MTIDEAIAYEREKARVNRLRTKHPAVHRNDRDEIEACLLCAEEHEQLAEWLEELKDYRDKNKMVVRIDCINSEEFKDMAVKLAKEQYNKAIDDFSEKIKENISESLIWGMLVDSHKDNSFNDTSDKIVDYVIDTVKETAEQLKECEQNDR